MAIPINAKKLFMKKKPKNRKFYKKIKNILEKWKNI